MSGKWDPINRQASKAIGYAFGGVALLIAARWGDIELAKEDPSKIVLGLVGGLFLLAGSALLPGTVVPLIYRIIDRIGKDAPPE